MIVPLQYRIVLWFMIVTFENKLKKTKTGKFFCTDRVLNYNIKQIKDQLKTHQ